jgi:predicted dehydrogenase
VTRLRVGLIGIDHFHATGWAESVAHFGDRLEPVALYDPNPEIARTLAPAFVDPTLAAALPDAFRVLPFYSDLDRLLREQPLDLAVVTLLNRNAPPAIERLAAAGVHLLVDKPGARTAADAARAFAAARAAGVKVAVGLTKRYGPGWRDARAAITAGRLGRLLSAEAVFVSSSVAVRNPANHLFDWELSGGGVLHWIGIHDLDALLWLAGERVVELQAMTATVGSDAIDVEDVVSLALRFANGALATVHYAYALPRPGSDGYLALRGSRSSVKITPEGNVAWFGPADAGDPIAAQQTTYTVREARGYGAAALAIIDDLLAAIRDDRDPAATGEDLVRALELVDAAYLAATTGERVRVP